MEIVTEIAVAVNAGENVKNKSLNVLVFGSGAREHAIADSISKSPLLNKLYLAQTGIFKLGEVIEFNNYDDLAKKCADLKINIAVFGPEGPLCEGIVDIFQKYNIPCIGVNKHFSQLESSKLYGKKFMEKYGIKTAKYEVISNCPPPQPSLPSGEGVPSTSQFTSHCSLLTQSPIVIKADGLCDGKGVVIANNKAFAEKTITDFLGGKFGENSKTVLLEEFLKGEEISLISLWDGKNLLHFPPARDFKKLNKSESAPNTGGMGAFCPVKVNAFQKKLDEYKIQLEKALKAEKADFVGFIYSGLIMAQDKYSKGIWDWHVLEYNVRMGDPEAQAILAHLKTDFLTILQSAVEQNLGKIELEYNEDISACLTIACEGYPKPAEFQKRGEKITLPEETSENLDIKIFYAGVEEKDGELYSNGGRVLSLCTTSQDPFWDLKNFAKEIEMKHKYFRTDMEVR